MAQYYYLMHIALLGTAFLGYSLTVAYKSGAPESQCFDMRPGHRLFNNSVLIDPQSGSPFYTIAVNKTKGIMPGEYLEVTIKADNCYPENMTECYFEGFLIQARDPVAVLDDTASGTNSNMMYGKFMSTDSRSKTLCSEKGMTHSSGVHKDEITFIWQAPDEPVNNIQFRATVVKGYDTFFMYVRSDVLNNSLCIVPSFALLVIVSLFNVLSMSL